MHISTSPTNIILPTALPLTPYRVTAKLVRIGQVVYTSKQRAVVYSLSDNLAAWNLLHDTASSLNLTLPDEMVRSDNCM